MKTINVTSCGDCPFLNRQEEFAVSDSCTIDPGPPPRFRGRWRGIEVSLYKVPADCPLRREMVRVRLDKLKAKLKPPKPPKKSQKSNPL